MANFYGSGLYGADIYSATVPIAGTLNYYTYYGYAIPKAARIDTQSEASVPLVQAGKGTVFGWGVDSDQQFLQTPWANDKHLSDEGTEKVTLPFNDWMTDAILQKPTTDPYTPDRDLLDTGIELINYSSGTIIGWDTDAFNQMLQPVWYVWMPDKDLVDTGVELIQYKLTTGWDTDADLHLINLSWLPWTPDKELADSSVELITYKLVESWDTDSENQLTQYLLNLWTPDKELADSGVEYIISPPAASTQVIDTYYGYLIPKSARGDEAVGFIQFTVPIVTLSANWVMDVENQIPSPLYTSDKDLSDSSVEYLTIKQGWDTDAEQQLNFAYIAAPNIAYGQFYNLDGDVSDLAVEKIIITSDWTPAEDNQKQWADYTTDKDIDTGLNLFNSTIGTIVGWDTDADIQWSYLPPWQLDRDISDSSVELIIYGSGVITAHDTDADNQIQQLPWWQDGDVSDAGVELILLSAQAVWMYDTQDLPQQLQPIFDDIDGIVTLIAPSAFTLDIEHQIPQLIWANDIVEDRGLLFTFAPVMSWDNDSEQQYQLQQNVRYLDEADIFIQTTTGWNDYDQNPLLVGYSVDILDKDATNYLIVPNAFDDNQERVWPDLVKDDPNDNSNYPLIPVMELDSDSDLQIPSPVWALDLIEERNEYPIIVNAFDDIQDKVWDVYSKDQIDEQNRYPIVTLITQIDLDSEQQLAQAPWQLDVSIVDAQVEYITLYNDWSSDDNQRPQDQYILDKDIDNNVAFIFIPFDWGTDSENQKAQAIWVNDQLDEQNKYPIIPTMELDNDAEYQRQQDGYNVDRHLSDEGIEFITLPFIPWDTDSDVQFVQSFNIPDRNILDDGVEFITLPSGWDLDTERQIVWPTQALDIQEQQAFIITLPVTDLDVEQQFKWLQPIVDQLDDRNVLPVTVLGIDIINYYTYYGYAIPKPARAEEGSWTQYLVIPLVDYTWDNDEQQLQQPQWNKDDLSDSGVEFITSYALIDIDQQLAQGIWIVDVIEERNLYPIIPIQEIDNDSEQQRAQDGYSVDRHISDESVEYITLPIISSELDHSIQFTAQNVFDTVDESVQVIVLPVQELDVEKQIPWAVQALDIQELQAYNIVLSVIDLDAEQQFQWLQINTDQIDERNLYPIIPIQEIDNDSEQQKLQPDWYKDHLSDEGVELITLPPTVPYLYAWDTDTENQIPQAMWYRDKLEDIDFVNYIVIPATVQDDIQYKAWESKIFDQDESYAIQVLFSVLDLDVEQQFPSTVYTGLVNVDESVFLTFIQVIEEDNQQRVWLEVAKDSVDDYAIQVTTVPTFVESVDLQFVTPLFVVSDNVDERVNVIIPAFITVLDSDEQQFARYVFTADSVDEIVTLSAVYVFDSDTEQQFTNRIFTSDNIDEEVLLPRIPLLDQDAEQQKLWADTFKDDLLDTGVEYITLPPLGEIEVTDADQQISWIPQFGQDDISDSSVEIILYPGGVISAWDLDSEQQIPQAKFMLDMDLMDVGVERITLPAPAWDTDSENQLSWMPYTPDKELMDSGTELISYVPGIVRDWDSDIGNQIPNPNWYIDYWEERDINQNVIPPTIIYVMIVYKVTAFALLDAYVNVIPQMALANLSTALNMAVTQVAAAPQMLIANITVTLRVICKSVTNLSLGY
jgi:hypothetical protein